MPDIHRVTVETGTASVQFARELTDREQEQLGDAIAAALQHLDALADTKAHPVHLASPVIEEPDLDEDGEPIVVDGIPRVTRRLAPEAMYCPDCGRAVQAGNDRSVGFDFLVCPSVVQPLPKYDWPCHPGCLVACGVTER